MLSCISGVNFLSTKIGKSFRFGIVYDLLSLTFNTRVRIKIYLNEMSVISSQQKNHERELERAMESDYKENHERDQETTKEILKTP